MIIGSGEYECNRLGRTAGACIALFAGLCLAGCGPQPGERAEKQGRCPPGETCSDRAPAGLLFRGRDFFGVATEALFPTAIGGTQTVTALDAAAPNEIYVAGIDAKIVDSNVAMVVSPGPTSFVLRGASRGKSLLRALVPRTNELLDRVEITVAPIDRVAVVPFEYIGMYVQSSDDSIGWALLDGGKAQLAVVPMDDEGTPLVDEGMTFDSQGAEVARETWDLHQVVPWSTGGASFTTRAGGEVFTNEARVVASVEDVSLGSLTPTDEEPIQVSLQGEPAQLCFVAGSGGALVAGASWSFAPSDGIEIERRDPDEMLPKRCVKVRGTVAGPATLGVRASNASKTFRVVVVEQ